ncbi:hypothetical protein ORI60_21095 [Lentzea sp. NEAU-D7]|nr:hypothetical protein [Lentzea sp. NEAU-D7]MCX2950830.1 hypothetical protein [Lentzea sp. NEAU-D7]
MWHSEDGDHAARSGELDLDYEGLYDGLALVGVACLDDGPDVGVDLFQGGGIGHGGLVLQFFPEFGRACAELLLFGAVAAYSFLGGVVVGVEEVVFERVQVLVDLRGDGFEPGLHGVEFGGHGVVAGLVDLAGFVDGVADEVELVAVEAGDGVEYGLVERIGVEAVLVAGVLAVLHALHARVVAVGLGLAGGAGADHRVLALGTVQAAGGHVVGVVGCAARVAFAA